MTGTDARQEVRALFREAEAFRNKADDLEQQAMDLAAGFRRQPRGLAEMDAEDDEPYVATPEMPEHIAPRGKIVNNLPHNVVVQTYRCYAKQNKVVIEVVSNDPDAIRVLASDLGSGLVRFISTDEEAPDGNPYTRKLADPVPYTPQTITLYRTPQVETEEADND